MIAGVVAGCASNDAGREIFKQRLRMWFGATERNLVDHWGPPSSVYEVTGARYLTYRGYPRQEVSGTGTGRTVWTMYCTVTFSVEDGVVAAWRYEGNDCY